MPTRSNPLWISNTRGSRSRILALSDLHLTIKTAKATFYPVHPNMLSFLPDDPKLDVSMLSELYIGRFDLRSDRNGGFYLMILPSSFGIPRPVI